MTNTSHEFSFASVLHAPVDVVWARATSAAGITHEFAPWLRMTLPPDFVRLDAQDVPLNTRLFRSWLLLGGVLPIDYDDLVLVSIDPGRGFHERSSMASALVWEHRRTLRDDAPGRCVLTDVVRFVPRVGFIAPALLAIATRTFAHRHRQLRKHFGGEALPPSAEKSS